MKKDKVDFRLAAAGRPASIFLLTPVSHAAKKFVREHVHATTTWGGAVVVEHRYIEPIVARIVTDGFTLQEEQ